MRAGGLGQALAEHLPRREIPLWLAIQAAVLMVFGWVAWLSLAIALMLFAWMRWRFVRRLGGTTGDTAGALVEVVEMVVLSAVALV
ncbi:cobalamin synthase [compost metagenome]